MIYFSLRTAPLRLHKVGRKHRPAQPHLDPQLPPPLPLRFAAGVEASAPPRPAQPPQSGAGYPIGVKVGRSTPTATRRVASALRCGEKQKSLEIFHF